MGGRTWDMKGGGREVSGRENMGYEGRGEGGEERT